jgi:lysophospholipase L1-like esterase
VLSKARERAALVLMVVLSPLVFLALTEVAAHLVGVKPLAEDQRYRERVRHRSCRFNPEHARISCKADQFSTSRDKIVIALGGSSVQGYPLKETIAFSRQLDSMLGGAYPGEYAVFNRGRMCKDSIYVRECARNALRAEPDYLVVYAGHNDFANWGHKNPGRRIFLEENAWIYELELQLSRSRSFSALARSWRRLSSSWVRGEAEPSVEHRERSRRLILDKFEANLSALIELAGAGGTDVILVTVVSNLHEFPIRRERWSSSSGRESATAVQPAHWTESYWRGVDLFEGGRFAEALEAFKEARDQHEGGRAPTELNERIRLLSEHYDHVHLVDFEQQLDRLGVREGIGCNFFGSESYCDQFHPNTRTQGLIAEAIFRKLEALRSSATAVDSPR